MRVDLHMHTGYSEDAQYPQTIEDKINACEQAGLDIIGITDHLDFLPGTAASRCWPVSRSARYTLHRRRTIS